MVESADGQPLLLLTDRLFEAFDTIGSPLVSPLRKEWELIKKLEDDSRITQDLQRLLDPLCLFSVVVDAQGGVKPTLLAPTIELHENGWRPYLVKVVNRSKATSKLRIESPNSRPIPHGPAADIENRWLSLSMFEGRPLLPNLSGLELEYRIVHLYAAKPGEKQTRFEFSVGGPSGKKSSTIKSWRFNRDTAGWGNTNQCTIRAVNDSLRIEQTGDDPYFSTPIQARGGRMRLRWWGTSAQDGIAQVFWWTGELPSPDGTRLVNVQVFKDRQQEYVAEFQFEGELAGIRMDPNVGVGSTTIDWIDLEYADGESTEWVSLECPAVVQPSYDIVFDVKDADQTKCMGCFEIRDTQGRVYPHQPKRQAPDMFFQSQIYRESGETIRLPTGKYTVRCTHGPECIPVTLPLEVIDRPVRVEYQVERWIDCAKLGYWSGDHHIHAAGCLHYENPVQGVLPEDMLRHIMGEDLKVGCCLTWGPCFDFQKQFFRGRPDDVSRYPYLLRYDIEVSGFGSQVSGHLNLLNLKQQIPPGGLSKNHWPTLGLNTLKWAKSQGAITGTAHSGSGLTNSVGRTAGTDGLNGLPNFNIPAFDGIGANEFIMQATHVVDGPNNTKVPAIDFIATMNTPRSAEWNIWYHVLNCGFPVVASGETDFPCMTGERVGIGRVYVKLDGKLDYTHWVHALQAGESYVSDGTCHLMNFRKLGSGEIAVDASALHSTQKDLQVELVVNGRPIESKSLSSDGVLREIRFAAPTIAKSSWVAVRVFPHAHSNPIRLMLDGKPIRASRESAEWCLACVDQCWQSKKQSYQPEELQDAKEAYDHARKVYRQIRAECDE